MTHPDYPFTPGDRIVFVREPQGALVSSTPERLLGWKGTFIKEVQTPFGERALVCVDGSTTAESVSFQWLRRTEPTAEKS